MNIRGFRFTNLLRVITQLPEQVASLENTIKILEESQEETNFTIVQQAFKNARSEAEKTLLMRGLIQALQEMIILHNGAVPGKTSDQVFLNAVAVRNRAQAYLDKLNRAAQEEMKKFLRRTDEHSGDQEKQPGETENISPG